jgi:hypothetical protein
MILIQLPLAEADRLKNLFQATDDRKLRDRLQIILMARRGRARQDIAQDLGMHRRSVTRWLNAYCDGGLDALRPRKAKGNPPKIPASLAEDIRTWVIERVQGCPHPRSLTHTPNGTGFGRGTAVILQHPVGWCRRG